MKLSTFAQNFDDMEELLQALVDAITNKEVSGGGGCCPDPTGLTDLVDGTGLLGDDVTTTGSDIVVGVGDPPVSEDWESYSAVLCDGASKYADGLADVFDVLEGLHDALKTVTLLLATAILATLLPLMGITAAAAGTILGTLRLITIVDGIKDLILDGKTFWDDYEQDIRDARQDIICAIILATTPVDAASRVRTVLQDANPNAYAWLNLLTFIDRSMEVIFSEESTAGGGYGEGACGVCDAFQYGEFVYRSSYAGASVANSWAQVGPWEYVFNWSGVQQDAAYARHSLTFTVGGEDCATTSRTAGQDYIEVDYSIWGAYYQWGTPPQYTHGGRINFDSGCTLPYQPSATTIATIQGAVGVGNLTWVPISLSDTVRLVVPADGSKKAAAHIMFKAQSNAYYDLHIRIDGIRTGKV